ncbi:MAG: polyribonucleotide nucleotidyltransferase, partial [Smithellaceae bacterium]
MSNVFSADFAGRNISLKTNYVAGQADGSVLVYYGETVVLVTAVSLKAVRAGMDFLPLTVDYQEKTFAAGKIPGGFFKREGRLNEREILLSRIIDRSIRPLFPKGYYSETQLVATVLSVDDANDPEVAAMLGASAALEMSDIPFKGPVAGVRIGRINGELVCNASPENMLASELNIFMVGRKITPGTEGRDYDVELVMLEGDAQEVDEDVIVDAIKFGLEAIRPVIDLQDKMRQAVGREKRTVEEIVTDEELTAKVRAAALAGLEEGYSMSRKLERYGKLDEVREKVIKEIGGEDPAVGKKVAGILEEIERRILREMIIRDKKRIDGRSSTDIRPISSEVGILPRAHGSALFNRGETQAVVA